MLVVRPHEPDTSSADRLAQQLSARGFVVLVPDLRPIHADREVLERGLTPQQVLQSAIDLSFAYLRERSDVDSARIAIVGGTFTSLLAAALHPEVSAVVLERPGSLADTLREAAAATNMDELDVCTMLPGLLKVGSERSLMTLLVPRPLLLMNAHSELVESAKEFYLGGSATVNAHEASDALTPDIELRWLAREMRAPTVSSTQQTSEPLDIELSGVSGGDAPENTPLSLPHLEEQLGKPLPRGRFGFGLRVAKSTLR